MLSNSYFIPLIYLSNKWRFPTSKPIITLRIDSDFGTQESLRTLYELADSYSAILTTFLHVKAHEDWLDWFAQWSNHEHAYMATSMRISPLRIHSIKMLKMGIRR